MFFLQIRFRFNNNVTQNALNLDVFYTVSGYTSDNFVCLNNVALCLLQIVVCIITLCQTIVD